MRKSIAIDPAHGGDSFGVVGPSGLRESLVNLDVALLLRDLLTGFDVDIKLTRDTDKSPGRHHREYVCSSSDWALQIHHGGTGQQAPVEVWHRYRADSTTKDFAKLISKSISKSLNLEPGKTRLVSSDRFHMFKVAPKALMVFPGNLSTYVGEQKLRSQEILRHEAEGMMQACVEWLGL